MEKTEIKKTKAVKKVATKKVAVKKSVVVKSPELTPLENKYTVALKMMDLEFKESGITIQDCLNQIRPAVYKSKGEFTVECGGKKSTVSLRPFQVRQILLRPLNQEIFSKRMISILK